MTSRKKAVTIGGKPGSFMMGAVADYITLLKGRLGLPIPEMSSDFPFHRKILVTYVDVSEFLRQGQPLSDEERQDIEDCVTRWERLLVKMKAHQALYNKYCLWEEGAAQREAGNPGAQLFDLSDLRCLHEALAEYLVACRLVEKRADFTEDEGAELGNDFRLYEMGYDAATEAQRCLWEEIRNGKAPLV